MNNKIPLLALLGLASATPLAHSQVQANPDASRFIVGDIRVVGLQRVSEGTIYNYLPVNIGDELTPQRVREAVHALHETGFFRNVELYRDGSALVVSVRERPTIESFQISGNKDIKTEDLMTSLRGIGLAQGKTFNRSVLEEVKAELTDQYFSQGKYGVSVETNIEELPDNLVRVGIEIKEGSRAKIRQINIVGNETFSDKEIIDGFELMTPKWNNWWKPGTSYSREMLTGDLEKLRSFYLDRGYADFQIESAQVQISDDKSDMFITISIDEGDIYRIADARVAGNTIVPASELQRLVIVRKGEIYSQQRISATQKLIENYLGSMGYAFAEVDPVPRLDEEKKEVTLTFLVNPGKRVYVRHINFSGMTRTQDVVLRREMRQLEGSWVSNAALELSKQRIQRLPYIEEVDFDTKRVEGTDDLVDVDFTVKEGPSATLSGGLGYSQSQRFMLTGSYVDSNFFGTGKRVALDLSTGRWQKYASFSHTNQYAGIHNISRTYSLSYSDLTQFVSASSDFSSKSLSAGVQFGYPISELQGLRFGANVSRSDLMTTSAGSALQAQIWVQENGKPYSRSIVDNFGNVGEIFGSRYTAFELTAGWYRNTLNRGLFPDRGQQQTLGLTSSVPGSAVEYYIADYSLVQYIPIWRRFTGMINVNVAYGDAFGDTTALPPYRQFYGGGPDTVRGFRESYMGPRDNWGNPYGGNLLTVGRAELILPMPQKWQTSARVSLFYDIGNVFATHDIEFFGDDGLTPLTYKFKFKNLRRSTGLSVEWLAPLGLFRFSYGIPLNASKGEGPLWADETERFQFSIGQAF
jgi:outer membrane protein insertion porin family|nr:MAG: outer membrane protein assembly factor BamA [Pseudomonadota bacterium]